MSWDDYLKSGRCQHFLDETLRDAAYQAVDHYLDWDGPKVKDHQVHMIQDVVQDSGAKALETLAKNQKRKETSKINQDFWDFLDQLLTKEDKPTFGIWATIKREMAVFEGVPITEFKKIRQNLLNLVAPIYFENFVSHFLYKQALAKRDQAHANAD